MIGTRQEIPRMQSDFYKSWYHKLLQMILVCMVIMVLLILGIIYFIVVKPSQQFYATTTEGQIIPMASLER